MCQLVRVDSTTLVDLINSISVSFVKVRWSFSNPGMITSTTAIIISIYSAATVLQLASSAADYNDTLTCEDPLAANVTEIQVSQ